MRPEITCISISVSGGLRSVCVVSPVNCLLSASSLLVVPYGSCPKVEAQRTSRIEQTMMVELLTGRPHAVDQSVTAFMYDTITGRLTRSVTSVGATIELRHRMDGGGNATDVLYDRHVVDDKCRRRRPACT